MPNDGNKGHADGSRDPKLETCTRCGLPVHDIYYRTQQCALDTKGWSGEAREYAINVADGGRIELELCVGDLRQVVPALAGPFDAVFHDPFSPASMPELWTLELFAHYARLLDKPHGKLLTYSTAAAVRGALQQAGFQVYKTPALGGKLGGTIAGFVPGLGLPLDAYETAYIASRAGIPYSDPTLSLSGEAVRQHRAARQQVSDRPPGNAIRKSKPRP